MSTNVISPEEDPIEFWLSQSATVLYPSLKNVALDLLLTPASSVASERIVSRVNFILRDSRSSLTSKNVNSIVVLRSYSLDVWSSLVGVPLSK
jgi:hAT family C-terminal dimerisation region